MTEYTVVILVGIAFMMIIVGKTVVTLRPALEKWLANHQRKSMG